MNQKASAGITLVVLVMAATLTGMGRQFWCQCGTWVPWSWDIWTEHNSQHLIDPYFFTHVLHGVILFWGLSRIKSIVVWAKWVAAAAIEAGWEILENSPMIIDRYRESTMALGYTGDSVANSIFDVVACLLGFWIASRMRFSASLAIFVAIEVCLLLTIRDCLLLNIVMLVEPIEAVKQWQTQGQ